MSLTRLDVLKLFLDILFIETEVQQLFNSQGVNSVRKLLNNKYGTYQYLVDKKLSKLPPKGVYQITIFWNWHKIFSSKNSICKEAQTINNITET